MTHAVVALALLVAGTAGEPRRERVAVLPLTSLGSTAEATGAVERILLGELRKILEGRLRTPAELVATSPKISPALEECDGVPACLAEVVGALGWELFLVGNVAGIGDSRAITLRLFDARTGAERGRVALPAAGDENVLIPQMRRAVVELVAPELFVGQLELNVPQPGVTVLLDGEPLATGPLLGKRFVVRAGRHSLEASGENLVPMSDFLELAYEEVKALDVQLPINTVFVSGDTPFRARWWTWAAAGAGALAVGLGGYFHRLAHEDRSDIEERAEACAAAGATCRLTAENADLYGGVSENRSRAVAFYASGAALLGGVGVLLTIDFF